MNWYVVGTRWMRCEIVSHAFGMATVRLYTGEQMTGRARKGVYGLLVEGK